MNYPEQEIAEHLDSASASLEMVLEKLDKYWHPYYEKMSRDIAIAQQQIDRYLTDMRQITV